MNTAAQACISLRIKLATQQYFIYILFVMMFCACVGDEIFPAHAINRPDGKELDIVMQIPGANIPVTFATAQAAGENIVETVNVLVFKVEPDGKEYFHRHIPVRSIEISNSTTKRFTLTLSDSINARLILLANVDHLFTQEIIARLHSDSIAGNLMPESILNRFVFGLPEPLPVAIKRYGFPMYGRSEVIKANEREAGDITMIRSVARIDIADDMPGNQLAIDSVYIFNARNCGYVAPALDTKGNTLETPNVPPAAAPESQPFGYRFTPNMGVTTQSMEGEIYVSEDRRDNESATVIVLKTLTASGQPHYYPVDLQNAYGQPLPILRNCRYRIFIRSITGDGYITANEAATGTMRREVSLDVEMNELGLGNIVFNDQYKLAVSNLAIDIDPENQSSFELKVYTTYHSWSASITTTGEAWLSFDGETQTGTPAQFPAARRSLILKAEENNSGSPRVATINLKAGTLKQVITVTQHSNRI
jgi:hypothetical protein